jgi:CBS domain containing-hemolysin-like protein
MEWYEFVLVAVLICLSGLFSGLTLGLMGLDKVILNVLIEQRQEKEEAIK